jgi:hypothetical protein
MVDIPQIEQVKIQAKILIPLIKALRSELGEERANAILRKALGDLYAKFFYEIGEPELGFLLVCGADFPMTEGFSDGVKLTRTQTIMQGATHCDFRYALKK